MFTLTGAIVLWSGHYGNTHPCLRLPTAQDHTVALVSDNLPGFATDPVTLVHLKHFGAKPIRHEELCCRGSAGLCLCHCIPQSDRHNRRIRQEGASIVFST